jgi:hypothetical protein
VLISTPILTLFQQQVFDNQFKTILMMFSTFSYVIVILTH